MEGKHVVPVGEISDFDTKYNLSIIKNFTLVYKMFSVLFSSFHFVNRQPIGI